MPSTLKTSQIRMIQKRLLAWFARHQRHLPWRQTKNPYLIWISEVMLQQTQVKTVVNYYQRFTAAFPDVGDLAAADLQQVLKLWEGLGYYSRARNLHQAAKIVVSDHQGRIPEDFAVLKTLPGIGDYIAAAVASIAFERPFAVVDGNVKRVLSRLLLIDAPVNKSSAYPVYRNAAQRLLDHRRPGNFNQAMMELGALICAPRQPRCDRCPLKQDCAAFHASATGTYPRRLARKTVPLRPMAAAVIYKADRLLITRRQPQGLLGGLWEFPGGELNAGESASAACLRSIKEQVNLAIEPIGHLIQVRHAYTHFKITLDVICCRYLSGRVKRNGPADHRWIAASTLKRFAFPKAHHKFIPLLLGNHPGKCKLDAHK